MGFQTTFHNDDALNTTPTCYKLINSITRAYTINPITGVYIQVELPTFIMEWMG